MSPVPPFERRGFRDWPQVLSDLACIAGSPPPINAVAVGHTYGPWPQGALTCQSASDGVTLLGAGVAIGTVERKSFAGAWLYVRDEDYALEMDLGELTRDSLDRGLLGATLTAPRRIVQILPAAKSPTG